MSRWRDMVKDVIDGLTILHSHAGDRGGLDCTDGGIVVHLKKDFVQMTGSEVERLEELGWHFNRDKWFYDV